MRAAEGLLRWVQPVPKTLWQRGPELPIDDYRHGSPRLSDLLKRPVRALKINRCFVAAMVDEADLAAIVGSTLDLGLNPGRKLVAAGVEDAAGLLMLRQLGCEQALGYCVSRPWSAADLSPWLRTFGFSPGRTGVAAPAVAATGTGTGTGTDLAAVA